MCPGPKGNIHWVHSRLWRAQDKAHPAILVLEGELRIWVLTLTEKQATTVFGRFRYLLSNCRPCKGRSSSMHPSLEFGYHSAVHCFLQLVKMSETGRRGGKTKENLVHMSVPCALVMGCKMLLCAADYGARFPKIFRPLNPTVARMFLRATLLLNCNCYYSWWTYHHPNFNSNRNSGQNWYSESPCSDAAPWGA